METDVALDQIDRGLLHCLQVDGRASARTIAAVLAVSETTVARRYQRLRADGRLRVVGQLAGSRLGYSSWLIRLQATPDAAVAVAAALARRTDTSWVYLLSGGTEVLATAQVRDTDARDELLLAQLPRTRRVLSMSAHRLLRAFVLPQTWGGPATLSAEQIDVLRRDVPDPEPGPPPRLDDGDHTLLAALARDGRTSLARLAAAGGFSESTARRRLDRLRRSGVLALQLDVDPALLGYGTQARLWMTVAPRALTDVAAAVATHPEAVFVAVTTGASNLTAAVACRDDQHLYEYLADRIAPLDGIRTMETAPVIRTVKRGAA